MSKPFLFAALTWVVSFGYQIFFYKYYEVVGSPLTLEKTVFSYISGVVGDGVIVPVINFFALGLLLKLKPQLSWVKVLGVILVAFLVTSLLHFAQGSFSLTNWAMPTPFNLSEVGKFHYFFMWAEFSFLFFTFWETLVRLPSIYRNRQETKLLALTMLAIAAFLVTFVLDYAKIIAPQFR